MFIASDTGISCADLGTGSPSIMSVLHLVFLSIQVVIVVVLIVLAVMDLFKAVTSGDDKAISKSLKTIGIRLIASIAVFLVPALLSSILGMIFTNQKDSIASCVKMVVSGEGLQP